MEKKDVHTVRGESQRRALPISHSTYVIDEQQAEFGIGAPALFYLFFFGIILTAVTRNFILVAFLVGVQGFIFRNLLKDKPKNFLPQPVQDRVFARIIPVLDNQVTVVADRGKIPLDLNDRVGQFIEKIYELSLNVDQFPGTGDIGQRRLDRVPPMNTPEFIDQKLIINILVGDNPCEIRSNRLSNRAQAFQALKHRGSVAVRY